MPPNMERITNCPEAVKEGSKAPGSTDTIPREMDTGIAMTRHITKIINTTTADMFSPPPFCFSLLQIFFPEELTRYIFVWAGFLSVSYCTKKCVSIKIEQFVAMFPRRGKAVFKLVNHTFELIFFFYLMPFAVQYLRRKLNRGAAWI